MVKNKGEKQGHRGVIEQLTTCEVVYSHSLHTHIQIGNKNNLLRYFSYSQVYLSPTNAQPLPRAILVLNFTD